jgi:hypothetical protein
VYVQLCTDVKVSNPAGLIREEREDARHVSAREVAEYRANDHPVKRRGLPQRRTECMGFRRIACPAAGTEATALNPRVCSCVR